MLQQEEIREGESGGFGAANTGALVLTKRETSLTIFPHNRSGAPLERNRESRANRERARRCNPASCERTPADLVRHCAGVSGWEGRLQGGGVRRPT